MNRFISSAALTRMEDLGGLAGLLIGRGLFITWAMLGGRFMLPVEGVGGWIARWTILGVPLAANSVLMERPRAFFLDPGPEGGGESERGDGLRDTDENGSGTEGASALSPMGKGIVGLSGRGVLLNLLPSLYAGGTPRR